MHVHSDRVVFLDIDDTLNNRAAEQGEQLIRQIGDYEVRVSPLDIDWLLGLHASGVQLIWSTSWDRKAPEFAREFGLPTDLEILPQGRVHSIGFGYSSKLEPVWEALHRHPGIRKAAVLDDFVGGKDFARACDSHGRVLIPEVDMFCGITGKVRDQVDRFLAG